MEHLQIQPWKIAYPISLYSLANRYIPIIGYHKSMVFLSIILSIMQNNRIMLLITTQQWYFWWLNYDSQFWRLDMQIIARNESRGLLDLAQSTSPTWQFQWFWDNVLHCCNHNLRCCRGLSENGVLQNPEAYHPIPEFCDSMECSPHFQPRIILWNPNDISIMIGSIYVYMHILDKTGWGSALAFPSVVLLQLYKLPQLPTPSPPVAHAMLSTRVGFWRCPPQPCTAPLPLMALRDSPISPGATALGPSPVPQPAPGWKSMFQPWKWDDHMIYMIQWIQLKWRNKLSFFAQPFNCDVSRFRSRLLTGLLQGTTHVLGHSHSGNAIYGVQPMTWWLRACPKIGYPETHQFPPWYCHFPFLGPYLNVDPMYGYLLLMNKNGWMSPAVH